ncbi:hypothetical protein COCVIDRAFT_40490 [Bipolaris victoriae FI3]|uniref:Uncharacterized protein n=1 Tax=Bipolaris victoriae (strain FI3) TaxID=930091 RepID=W7EDG9_BIPV3|nr:hypothetical protein COCVIDRAFT_40490 [Bipolaris victoriae FI3]
MLLGYNIPTSRHGEPYGSYNTGFKKEKIHHRKCFEHVQTVFTGGVDFEPRRRGNSQTVALYYEKYRDYSHAWWLELDLFHCLHCLNQLRKALRRDVYPEEKYRGMVHQLQCIDHLRQVIQCQATSVISPTEWRNGYGQYVAPQQVHTYRNFEKLHEFSKARWNGSISVPRGKRVPLHPERVHSLP